MKKTSKSAFCLVHNQFYIVIYWTQMNSLLQNWFQNLECLRARLQFIGHNCTYYTNHNFQLLHIYAIFQRSLFNYLLNGMK